MLGSRPDRRPFCHLVHRVVVDDPLVARCVDTIALLRRVIVSALALHSDRVARENDPTVLFANVNRRLFAALLVDF